MDTDHLVRRLKILASNAGKTQQEIADELGVTRQAVNHILTGRVDFYGLLTIEKFANACGFDVVLDFQPRDVDYVKLSASPEVAECARLLETLTDDDRRTVTRWVRMLPHLPLLRRKVMEAEVALWEEEQSKPKGGR